MLHRWRLFCDYELVASSTKLCRFSFCHLLLLITLGITYQYSACVCSMHCSRTKKYWHEVFPHCIGFMTSQLARFIGVAEGRKGRTCLTLLSCTARIHTHTSTVNTSTFAHIFYLHTIEYIQHRLYKHAQVECCAQC